MDILLDVVNVDAVVFVDAVVSVISFMLLMLLFLEHRKKQGPAGQRCVRMALKRHKSIKKA